VGVEGAAGAFVVSLTLIGNGGAGGVQTVPKPREVGPSPYAESAQHK